MPSTATHSSDLPVSPSPVTNISWSCSVPVWLLRPISSWFVAAGVTPAKVTSVPPAATPFTYSFMLPPVKVTTTWFQAFSANTGALSQ